MRHLRGLQAQILLWTILPLILILVGVSLGSITLHQSSMRAMVAERDGHLARLAAGRLNDRFQTLTVVLRTILDGTAGAADLPGALADVQPAVELFDQGLSVYGSDGALLARAERIPGSVEPDVAAVLTSARAAPGQTVYETLEPADRPALLLMARHDPVTARTVVGALSERGLELTELLDHVNQGPRETYLVTGGGRVIYHRDEVEFDRNYSVHAGVLEGLRGEAGSTFEHLPDEEEHVVGYAPLAVVGWALLIEEPWAHVIVPGLQYTLWAPVLVLVAAVASLLAIHFGLRHVVNPLQVLGRAASRLAWGDYKAIEKPVGGIDEIRDLQSTLQEMAEQMHRYQAGMRDYIAALTQAQEDERRRLARELHDETVQSMIALGQRVKILQLDWRERRGDGPQSVTHDVDERLSELSKMITKSLQEVRDVIRDLRPVYLEELGLVSALRTLANSTHNGVTGVSFEMAGEERRLPPDTELAVYRIAQAALSNVLRHGKADYVALRLEFGEAGVILTAEDNGVGFVPPERPSDLALDGHWGLMGMYERATRLGGHLSVRSIPGAGTKIAAFLPYAPPDAQEQTPMLMPLDRIA